MSPLTNRLGPTDNGVFARIERIRRTAAAVFFVLFLPGCWANSMTTKLQALTGQPASAAFRKLSVPTSEKTIAGRKVYIWARTDLANDGQCILRLFVDAHDTITGYDLDGNLYGCEGYLRRLGGWGF